jgi:hypothetical protein
VDWGQKASAAIGFKGHRDIAEKASDYFKRASISLNIYSKSLTILEKPQFF